MYYLDDNIAAIATAPGGGARGIVRASGPTIVEVLAAIFRPAQPASPAAIRRASRVEGELVADGLAVALPGALHIWPSRRSYTGQPLAEWHTLGSQPLVEAALRSICRAGARLAEPGEFTLRAFLAGRIDLTQAEAVLGVIDARNPAELHRALEQLAGGLAAPLGRIRRELVELLIDVEAGLDFVEEDIQFVAPGELCRRLDAVADEVARIAAQMVSRGDAGGLPRVVLRGAPNVGKSSLFNALIGQPGAIVSPGEGTTRDYLEATLDRGALRYRLVDTAGLVAGAGHPIDEAARQAASRQLDEAQLELLCLDSTRPPIDWEHEICSQPQPRPRIVVRTKCDVAGVVADSLAAGTGAVCTSSVTGQGLDALQARIAEVLSTGRETGSMVAATAIRSRQAVDRAGAALQAAAEAARRGDGDELVAAEIRDALDQLGTVVGAVCTEELLDGIFSRFCIGK